MKSNNKHKTMGHNINRKPNYPNPTKVKKHKPKSVLEWMKVFWNWLVLAVFVVVLPLCIVCQITYQQIQRSRVNKNPVETEAVITKFGKPVHLGTPVYFEYRVGDSVFTDDLHFRRSKTLKKFHVGQNIHIKYENGNPSNAIWEYEKEI